MKYIGATIGIASGPLKWSWLSCVIWLCLVAIGPRTVCAQRRSGSTDLRASVRKTVILSLSPNASHKGVDLNAFDNGGALKLVFSGSEHKKTIQVPLLIRSNSSYKITASVASHTAMFTQLQVLSVEASGKLVAGNAVMGVAVERQFDKRPGRFLVSEDNLSAIDASIPFTIFSGPRISLGGGLDSPHNALKVTLLLSVQAKVAEGSWTLDLDLQGSETFIDQVLLAPPARHDEPIQLYPGYSIASVSGPGASQPSSR